MLFEATLYIISTITDNINHPLITVFLVESYHHFAIYLITERGNGMIMKNDILSDKILV